MAAERVGRRAVGARFEGRIGGRVYEIMDNGEEGEWAVVTAWEPPHRLQLSWHPGLPRMDTEIELRFTGLSARCCRVDLEHRGWEVYLQEATQMRAGYTSGWETVWNLYVDWVTRDA
jgi:uncharacterized protein YndB with AHSA1/START domain